MNVNFSFLNLGNEKIVESQIFQRFFIFSFPLLMDTSQLKCKYKSMNTTIFLIFFLASTIIFLHQFIYSTSDISTSKILSKLHSNLKIDLQTVDSNVYNRLTFERRVLCNHKDQKSCYSTNKSLVISFWSQKSKNKWLSQNISAAFPLHSFDHIIFVHDNSIWLSHPNYKDFMWISIIGQHRLWYLKRFVLPSITRSYSYIWVIDDDAKLNFSPLHYQCVVRNLSISLSAPGRQQGALSHEITKVNSQYQNKIGRWTDFIETGPIFVASSQTWECIHKYIDSATGSGWGLDLVWCNLTADQCLPLSTLNSNRTCAILDVFTVDHQSNSVNSAGDGGPELSLYLTPYEKWKTQMKNLNSLAEDNQLVDMCRI